MLQAICDLPVPGFIELCCCESAVQHRAQSLLWLLAKLLQLRSDVKPLHVCLLVLWPYSSETAVWQSRAHMMLQAVPKLHGFMAKP